MSAKTLKLSPELERSLLAGVIWGAVPLDAVNPEELSGAAKTVYLSAKGLILEGKSVPLELPALLLILTDAYGVNREVAKAYLESVKAVVPSATGAESAVRKLREQHALRAVANAASGQLVRGEYDPGRLLEVVSATAGSSRPTPLSEELAHGLPDPPPRLALRSLPRFTERVGGGLVGLTVVSGEPAVGKSTFIWQAVLEANQSIPVLHYDTDNGLPTLMARTRQMLGNAESPESDLEAIRNAVPNLYLRDSIRTLDSDLVLIPPPALVVVDIFQDLPTQQEFERQGLAAWVKRLKAVARRGYFVLVASEVGRAFYNQVSMGAAKGTGEIEYAAELTLQMIATNSGAELHVVKNRHTEFRGLCVSLRRHRGFVWREQDGEAW